MDTNRIYAMQSDALGKVSFTQVWAQAADSELASDFSSLAVMEINDRMVLLGYNRTTQATMAYGLSAGAPQRLDSRIDLIGGPWDTISSFVFGNDPYLMTYRAADGTFGFFRIASDLSVSPPYTVAYPRNWPTKDFSTVAPFASLGAQYVLGYNFDQGTVAIYGLTTITSAPGGQPALLLQNCWYHTWAKGWTHFSFFQLGRSNFFFKINLKKLNVNIDHIQDNPAAGTVEIGSWLQSQLPTAEAIDIAATIPAVRGEPYILTYIASTGQTEVLHIQPDCLGWRRFPVGSTVAGASLVAAHRVGETSFVLFYGAKGASNAR